MRSPMRERESRCGDANANPQLGLQSPSGPSSTCSGLGSVHRVLVALRTRPLLPQEKIQKARECVHPEADKAVVTFGRDRTFAFDSVFDQRSRQEDLFKACTGSLIDAVFEGYNACVFAYGQTSSGKTFTMGSGSHLVAEEDVGLIPRVINEIFERCEAKQRQEREEHGTESGAVSIGATTSFKLRCQFLEIHNEEVKDLLDPSTTSSSVLQGASKSHHPYGSAPSGGIAIRENGNGQIVVAGAKEEEVQTREDLMRLLEMGSASRTTGDTRMNACSSRSHAIFTIILDQDTEADGGEVRKISAKFHLVDLAGSERQKKTGATGKRFKESVTINKGLLALGNVISALSSKQSHKHVPYRESKLTRMLQDSIGGNSRTIMIACVSTSDTNMEETLNTLKYASRARNIKNVTFVNYRKDPKEDEIPDTTSSAFVEDAQEGISGLEESEVSKQLVTLSTRLKDAEGRNSTLQRLLDDKIAIESSLQQLVHRFTSTGDMSKEASRLFKEAFLSSPRKAACPPRSRPLSAMVGSSRAPRTSDKNRPRSASVPKSQQPAATASPIAKRALDVGKEEETILGDDDFSVENEDEVLFDQGIEEEIFLEAGEDERNGSVALTTEESDLNLSKRKLEQELKQLSSHIVHKEELIEQLTKNQEEAQAASHAYESLAQELEMQVKEKEEEVERLKLEVSNLDESIAQSVEEKHELKIEYDEKLQSVMQQLSKLKRKLTENNATRLERVRKQSEEKILHLESDLESMRVKQSSLRKKLRDTQDDYEREVERKNKELELARKEADDRDRRIEQLEKQNKRQTTLLKKKAEEAASAQRKLKELNQNSTNVERVAASNTKGTAGSAKPIVAVGRKAPLRTPAKQCSKTKVALDEQVERLVQRSEIKEQLEVQKRRKIELMAEREGILQELAPYQQKKAKQEEIIKLKIREFMYAIEELDAEIDKMQEEASLGNEIAAKEVVELQTFRSDAYTRRCDLQNMLQTGKVLTEKDGEDLAELEDRLDGIVTEVDYVVQQINESKVQLEEAEASGRKMKKLMSALSQKEIQSLLGMYLNSMVEMYSKERKDAHRITELEVVLAEKGSQIDHLTSGIKARDFEYNFRTTQLEKEHADKMQDVFSHFNLALGDSAKPHQGELPSSSSSSLRRSKVDGGDAQQGDAQQDGDSTKAKEIYGLVKLQQEQMEVLDKQNHELKDTNKDLTLKVRQAQEQAEVSQNTYEEKILSMSLNLEESNNLNKSLMEEVSNYKKHLRSLGNAVRISRSSLRPLSAAQVQQKQMRASQQADDFPKGLLSSSPP
ncbi:kinesin [Chloropicon primus]|nr:kinesin [Chloropicon primus]